MKYPLDPLFLVRLLTFPTVYLRVRLSYSLMISHLEKIGPCGISLSQLIVENTWTRLIKYGMSTSQNFLFLLPLGHIVLTRNTDSACMYQTSAFTLGILYVLYAAIFVHLISGAWFGRCSLLYRIAKRHSFGISFSLHPVSMGLTPGENNVTSCFVNNTAQSAS